MALRKGDLSKLRLTRKEQEIIQCRLLSKKMMPKVGGVVLMAAATGNIDKLQMWVWKAQANVVRESRTSNWGSPRFFQNRRLASGCP